MNSLQCNPYGRASIPARAKVNDGPRAKLHDKHLATKLRHAKCIVARETVEGIEKDEETIVSSPCVRDRHDAAVNARLEQLADEMGLGERAAPTGVRASQYWDLSREPYIREAYSLNE